MQSENIAELAKALAAAQGEISHAVKDSTNPHFKSYYADLASVWDAVRKPLSKSGLSVSQLPSSDGTIHWLETTLLHSSGQFLTSRTPLIGCSDMQKYGSALTYARRYALAAIAGVAQDDDDANVAAKPQKQAAQAPVVPNEADPMIAAWKALDGRKRALLVKYQGMADESDLKAAMAKARETGFSEYKKAIEDWEDAQ